MSKLPYFILSILCAVSQHEIQASSDHDSESSTASTVTSAIASTATSAPSPAPTTTPSPAPPSASHSPRSRMHHSGPQLRAWYTPSLTPPAYTQGLRLLNMDNPTNVGLSIGKTKYGHGLAIHPHFVVARSEGLRPGFEIASYEDGKLDYFQVHDTFRKTGDNVVLIETKRPILLDNGHSEHDALFKQGYNKLEYEWARDYVKNWIETHATPRRLYQGEDINIKNKIRKLSFE